MVSGFDGRCLVPTVLLYCALTVTVRAQTSESHTADENQSWVTSSESQTNDVNSTRTITRHSQSGGRTLDDQSVLVRGPNGDFQPSQNIETETVQVDASTVRTTT